MGLSLCNVTFFVYGKCFYIELLMVWYIKNLQHKLPFIIHQRSFFHSTKALLHFNIKFCNTKYTHSKLIMSGSRFEPRIYVRDRFNKHRRDSWYQTLNSTFHTLTQSALSQSKTFPSKALTSLQKKTILNWIWICW